MKKTIFGVCLLISAMNAFALDEAAPVIILNGHKAQVRSIAFTKDSKQVITASLDSFIKIWPVKTGAAALTIGHGAPIEYMAYSPDGKYIASSGSDSSFKLWDARDGRLIRMPANPQGHSLSLVFSPDSDFLASGGIRGINIWKAGDLKQPFLLDTGGSWAKVLVFSPDGRFFLAAGGNKISVWNMEYGNIISAVTGRGGLSFGNKRDFNFGCMVFDAAFSDDSQYFSACGDDGTVKTWRAEDGLPAWKQPAHNGIALSLDFSKDFIATTGRDGMINFFEIKNGKPVFSLKACAAAASKLVFSPDGKYLAALCGDNTVPVWRMYRNSPMDFAAGVKLSVYIAGFIGLAGIAAIIIFFVRRKKAVKDWRL